MATILSSRMFAPLAGLMLFAAVARGEEPPPAAAPANARANVQKVPTTVSGQYEHGTLVSMRVGDRIAYLIKPKGEVDSERRWIWDFPFWLAIKDGFGSIAHQFYVERALAAGFHVAGVDVGASFASPAAADVCQGFYTLLTTEYRLHPRARLLCHSHGGLLAYGWALRHPTCVDRIAGMCPAIDFRTYPGLSSVASVPAKDLGYDLPLAELEKRASEFNPIDNLAPLAKAGVKIMHLHGDHDTLVPTEANAAELGRRYQKLNGNAEIVLLEGLGSERATSRGHDGPELYSSVKLIEFLLAE